MKNLFLLVTLMFSMAFVTDIQAQTTCTPAQVEACKKICGNNPQCTPEQAAACQKVCNKSKSTVASTNAVKVANTTTDKKASCVKTCSKTKMSGTSVNVSPAKLVGLDLNILPEEKKTECAKTCVKKTAVVQN